ncbi:vitelline membrane outer layer protein 1 homolog [Homarus americanus]|uniref:vitelline membrane outer layer protein 1 homolog n=1 Tax=Homarus americanus TaxID=6706 RepID=UPI001C491141|nr:vitelline membrane outer layer protein 1 homolog [Homarus americanus]
MRTTLFLALLVCFAAVLGQRDRIVTKSLVLDNGMDWGKWGEADYCDDGSFASFMEVKFEHYQLTDTDETAVNAVKLYCVKPDLHPTNYIISTEGRNGEWMGELKW